MVWAHVRPRQEPVDQGTPLNEAELPLLPGFLVENSTRGSVMKLAWQEPITSPCPNSEGILIFTGLESNTA